jgi:hypothetical protein
MRLALVVVFASACASAPAPVEVAPAELTPAAAPGCLEHCEQQNAARAVSAEKITADCERQCAQT